MDSPERIIVEVAIAIGAAIVGAVGAYYLTLRFAREEQERKRARDAYRACLKLRETLANWMNEIADATRQEPSVQAVMRRLLTVFEHERFQGKVGDRFFDIQDEPLCVGLLGKTNAFTRQAFSSKGKITMALIDGNYARDYAGHREDALQHLQSVYADFRIELERVIPLLKHKARM
ncbi:MAG TPA: hypothetical protein VHQ90_20630 [Thermoanaerobaculia bacterium]|nr:hypothetical protein [Thermoanaerobaculia bacterium]